MAKFGVLLMAAGQSSRFKGEIKKPYADIDGRAVWMRAADLFVSRKDVVQTILVIAADDEENVRRRYGPNLAFMNVQLTLGGAQRSDSVANGLALISDDVEMVAIHDAARPCTTPKMIDEVFAAAEQHGAAILAAPVNDTLKRCQADHQIECTVPREHLWMAQTPQVFKKELILKAYSERSKHPAATDDAQLVEALGSPVVIVPSDLSNFKITAKSDIFLADAVLKSRPKPKNKAFHPFADEDMWR
ncbi:MAG: 2-C-methyl-D-erythritol 4-phosphate cytidylyltransferase [Gemmatales bacterium]